ncbi:polysaccharide lyase family 1 protein [Cucurbitaria berberidis CBS 394.84]|uniref:Polysaccharide lyase family 1 protein n=1 Tax=Cucurbitaria berberidis CBS 394.84 TaxID=1168544 RepID=A0A9P4GPY2_9PLEO|nr:polysaccharide lyase family 1 protein [Cucurbitaria berberidis CBS 394.84]KAF1849570.1 polysaccharide lyase family 1 protein [Cucurbitaria berberidis CBS 394.84]
MLWKKSATALLFATGAASQNTTCKHCDESAHGFASLNGGTIGGKGGRTVFANTWNELKDYASRNGSLIIRVNGLIKSETRGYEIPIASHKTIIGVGKDSGLVGGGFAVKGTRNIILRNLQVSDTRIPEDWPGKGEDWDGIQVDTGFNIWIDHMKFARMNDGLIDLRRDSSYITVSSCIFSEHNKALGIGWTTNITAKVTINDNFFNSTNSRNPSADNLEMCHMYNNYFRNCTSYGTYARGHTSLLVEHSYYDTVFDPLVAGPNASIKANWIKFKHTEGEALLDVNSKKVFKASDYYQYSLRDPYDLPNDIPYFAGPQAEIGS